MKKNSATTVLALVVLTLGTACSAEEEGYKRPKVWPKPTEPPPASPIYHDVDEKMPSEEDLEREAAELPGILEEGLEDALLGDDSARREAAIVLILPELLQVEPRRVTDLHARLKPGEPRRTLGTEIAQYWTSSDPVAAARWIRSLEGDERRSAAMTAVTTLAPWDPGVALQLADEFDLEKEEALRKLLASLRKPLLDSESN